MILSLQSIPPKESSPSTKRYHEPRPKQEKIQNKTANNKYRHRVKLETNETTNCTTYKIRYDYYRTMRFFIAFLFLAFAVVAAEHVSFLSIPK